MKNEFYGNVGQLIQTPHTITMPPPVMGNKPSILQLCQGRSDEEIREIIKQITCEKSQLERQKLVMVSKFFGVFIMLLAWVYLLINIEAMLAFVMLPVLLFLIGIPMLGFKIWIDILAGKVHEIKTKTQRLEKDIDDLEELLRYRSYLN